jgi:hypothetical protein
LGLNLQERFLLDARVRRGSPWGGADESADFTELYNLSADASESRRSLRTVQGLLAEDGIGLVRRIILRIGNRWPKVRGRHAAEVDAFLGRFREEDCPFEEDKGRRQSLGGRVTDKPGEDALKLFRKIGISLDTVRLLIRNLHSRNLNSL